ncbi:MAG TPA: pyruvate kinase [Candidatus Limnocylindrales bacterium]|nr:pyruvate kinase [Candidatus Limnocylindrales bacterium]
MSDTPARRTKLICTIGPASGGRVAELITAGMNVARLNFSHGTPASIEKNGRAVRAAADEAGRRVALLADLSGPKIRIGDLRDGSATLEAGRRFRLEPRVSGAPGDETRALVTDRSLAREVRPGDRVLLADGAVELRVVTRDGDVETEVVRGGTIRSRAGVSIPSERMTGPPLTPKDRADVPRALALGVEYIAQSFVRRADDIQVLRELLGSGGPPIIAKIETRPAIDDFDAILDAADAVMIARGDLGVELPYEEVPIIQKQLVRRALDRGIPSIVATQMLESMISSPRPTRAEASDVANAVFDGADAIMLSGETAIGAFPVLAAEAAARICRLCEQRGGELLAPGATRPTDSDARALAYAAVKLAEAEPDIDAIACYTRSGWTARVLSSLRPHVPIFAFSPDPLVVARLALVHGVVAATCVPPADTASRLGLMAWLIREAGSVPPGSAVVLVASTADPGTGPNLLEVHRLPQ